MGRRQSGRFQHQPPWGRGDGARHPASPGSGTCSSDRSQERQGWLSRATKPRRQLRPARKLPGHQLDPSLRLRSWCAGNGGAKPFRLRSAPVSAIVRGLLSRRGRRGWPGTTAESTAGGEEAYEWIITRDMMAISFFLQSFHLLSDSSDLSNCFLFLALNIKNPRLFGSFRRTASISSYLR